jgi:hypothetical protein
MPVTPANLQRFADFMAANPSPENCVAGRFYLVPCISHPRLQAQYDTQWAEWIPLIGSLHEDSEHIGFMPWHIHVDTRFLTISAYPPRNDDEKLHRALARPVSILVPGRFNNSYYADLQENALLQMKRKRCRRADPPAWPSDAQWMGSLQAAYAGSRVTNGLCPHRGIPVACGKELSPGVRQCPGHGLAWNEAGCMVEQPLI